MTGPGRFGLVVLVAGFLVLVAAGAAGAADSRPGGSSPSFTCDDDGKTRVCVCYDYFDCVRMEKRENCRISSCGSDPDGERCFCYPKASRGKGAQLPRAPGGALAPPTKRGKGRQGELR